MVGTTIGTTARAATRAPSTEVLLVGDKAPAFDLRDQHGRSVTSARLLGRSNALLVFYPAVFSSICSSELRELRDWWPREGYGDTELLAISCDPMFSLRGYSDAEWIDFPLLSDFWPHGAVCRAFGVFDDRSGTAKRSSYLLDQEGRVAWSVHNAGRDSRPVSGYADALARLLR
jgi:mycoredoxin-dependent peroxiredoxin